MSKPLRISEENIIGMTRDPSSTIVGLPTRERILSSALQRDVLLRGPLHIPRLPHLVEDPGPDVGKQYFLPEYFD